MLILKALKAPDLYTVGPWHRLVSNHRSLTCIWCSIKSITLHRKLWSFCQLSDSIWRRVEWSSRIVLFDRRSHRFLLSISWDRSSLLRLRYWFKIPVDTLLVRGLLNDCWALWFDFRGERLDLPQIYSQVFSFLAPFSFRIFERRFLLVNWRWLWSLGVVHYLIVIFYFNDIELAGPLINEI